MATLTATWKNANQRKVGSEADATYRIEGEFNELDELAQAAHVGALEGRRFATCDDRVLRRLCSADFIEVSR